MHTNHISQQFGRYGEKKNERDGARVGNEMRQSRSTTSQITLQLSSEQCKTAGEVQGKTSAVRPIEPPLSHPVSTVRHLTLSHKLIACRFEAYAEKFD